MADVATMPETVMHDAVSNGAPADKRSSTPEAAAPEAAVKPFSWLDPHPTFVIVFVGKEETPFGLQKEFLCAKSKHFRDHFSKAKTPEDSIEDVVRLPDTPSKAFAYAQNYLYTGFVVPEADLYASDTATDSGADERNDIPSYDVLVDIWKLGHSLGIDGLCERTLEVMSENKRMSQTIPATATLVQVWKDTPEGSSIRHLLLSWAAEYLRSSEGRRAEFAKSLPQELLSELVVAMSSSYGDFWAMPATFSGGPGNGAVSDNVAEDAAMHDTNGHGSSYNSPISIGHPVMPPAKRARYFESYPTNGNDGTKNTRGASAAIAMPNKVNGGRKGGGRASMPGPRTFSAPNMSTPAAVAAVATAAALSVPSAGGAGLMSSTTNSNGTASAPGLTVKRRGHNAVDMDSFSARQKLLFCDDLLTRMLSGPGFWTRLVGPFREPVNPSSDGIPDYFDKVKRPMDLGTIKANLDNRTYQAPEEFLEDMRQIFSNVYTYWKKGDTIWQVCERLEKTFEEKYAQMNKWLAKLDGEDVN